MAENPQAQEGTAAAAPPEGAAGAQAPADAGSGSGSGGAGAAKTAGLPMAEITQAAEAAKAAARFQDAADALKKQAALVRDPAERERLWRAAYAKEKEAHGESKKARCKSQNPAGAGCSSHAWHGCLKSANIQNLHPAVMASGWGQGTGFGIGISSAVGMGLGNLVGALLSGVVAVPGSLIGAGVGAIHGPWYKLTDAVSGGGGGGSDGGDGAKSEQGAGPDRLGKDANKSAESGGGEKEGSETDYSDQDEEAHRRIVDAAKKLEEEEKKEEQK
jgi:hypothetical protein